MDGKIALLLNPKHCALSSEPVYRLAEKEWKDFIDEFTPLMTEADPHVPPLPPNDVVHRIYRDVRSRSDSHIVIVSLLG